MKKSSEPDYNNPFSRNTNASPKKTDDHAMKHLEHTSGSTTSFVVSKIIERAKATLFFIPPDNSEGNRSSTSCIDIKLKIGICETNHNYLYEIL